MIILFGLAGSGKGTQGKALSEIFGWRWISTGDLIRKSGKFADTINDGNMISDEDVTRLLEKELDITDAEGFKVVLDGYPRTAGQAEWLAERLQDRLDGAIVLDVPKEELEDRLYKRVGLDGRVDDQEKSSIARRWELFERNFAEIVKVLETHNVPIVHVDGLGDPGDITDRLVDAVEALDPDATEQENDVNGEEIEKSYGE